MFISVKVITRSRQEKVELQPDGSYKVWTRAVPEKGRANERVIELLAREFHKPKTSCVIVSGSNASKKIMDIK
ncbi:MAG: DUF167 family protein [Patescibacteria group bacterium]|nr:DUF167 family protein [Patescibacteria group bacterium]